MTPRVWSGRFVYLVAKSWRGRVRERQGKVSLFRVVPPVNYLPYLLKFPSPLRRVAMAGGTSTIHESVEAQGVQTLTHVHVP